MKTLLILTIGLLVQMASAQVHHLRSSRYDGTTGFSIQYHESFNQNSSLTLEAWVYRERDNQRETIITQGASGSFWFGFESKKLRFSRSGGFFAQSEGEVPRNQWTHVAASYNGTRVRFYIDGVLSGSIPLANDGLGGAAPLFLARSQGLGGSFFFKGRLDEVRLWSSARNGLQIEGGRFTEPRGLPDLEAVWPAGDGQELVRGGFNTPAPREPERLRNGMLPKDLIVPMAVTTPTLDGNVNPLGEYAGAEEVVLRYQDGPITRDATAYLVHLGNYLYIGIKGARLPLSGPPSDDNRFSVYFDADARTANFDGELLRGSVFVSDGITNFSRVRTIVAGNPPFQIVVTDWFNTEASVLEYQAIQGTARATEFSARDMEFRINRSVLGDFDEDAIDRFALHHSSNGGPNGDRWSTKQGHPNQPTTWSEMRYSPNRGTFLPSVFVQGRVVNALTGEGISGVQMALRGDGQTYRESVTSEIGEFTFFGVRTQKRIPVELVMMPPAGAILRNPSQSALGIQPILTSPSEVRFPACDSLSCQYSTVNFHIDLALPPTTLDELSTLKGWPRTQTRSGVNAKWIEASTIRIGGTNLHRQLEFFFAKPTCPNGLTGCVEGVDFFPASSVYLPPSGDESAQIEVTVPPIPAAHFGDLQLTAHDVWARPGNQPSQLSSWKRAPLRPIIGLPPYELLHGFSFTNEADGHDLDDYRAAFYDQACDPFHVVGFWAFAPIYLEVLGGGECVGMTVTAQQLSKGRSPIPLDPEVIFGNGFLTADGLSGRAAPKPATFNTSNFCSPEPTNVWAAIRANHGVQMSSESFGKTLEQFTFGRGLASINLSDQLDKLRRNPLDYMVCIRNGSRGHCVQPLEVIDIDDTNHEIKIWDCNYPNQVRTIQVDTGVRREYIYDGGFSEDNPWVGNWLFVYDIASIYDRERHVPSVEVVSHALTEFGVTHLWELFHMLVSGDAEPLVVNADGSKVGWENDGSFVHEGSQSVVIPQFNWIPGESPRLGHHPVSVFGRTDAGVPSISISNRGDRYKVHNSHHGTMFQMFVEGGQTGASDRLICRENGNRILGYDFEAGLGEREVEARIALCQDASRYPLAVAASPLAVPQGESFGLETLSDGTGFILENDTSMDMAPAFFLATPEINEEFPTIQNTPTLELPAGGRLMTTSPDGVDFTKLVFSVDRDRDGAPELVVQFDPDGDAFSEIAPSMTLFRRANGDLVIARRTVFEGWKVQHSETMEGEWDDVDVSTFETTRENGMTSTLIPLRELQKGFFRLARE